MTINEINETNKIKENKPKARAKKVDSAKVAETELPKTEEVKVSDTIKAVTQVEEVTIDQNIVDKTISQLADEVELGIHGSGRERMLSLGNRYAEVQQEMTRRYRQSSK